jgi:hypothetical protein
MNTNKRQLTAEERAGEYAEATTKSFFRGIGWGLGRWLVSQLTRGIRL